MLIKKMLGINKVEDYYLAEYTTGRYCGMLVLVVSVNGGYFDLKNLNFVEERQINYKKPLSSFENIEKTEISNHTARKIAKHHYKEFFKEYKELYLKDTPVLEDDDNTFYALV